MSVNLDQLPQAIHQQYQNLSWRLNEETGEDIGEGCKQHIVSLQGAAVLVTINMESKRDHLPDGIVDWEIKSNRASVFTSTVNAKVTEAVSNYFKNVKGQRSCYQHTPVRLFDQVDINGKKLEL